MTHESFTESEFVSEDEMQTTDSYSVNDTESADADLQHSTYQKQENWFARIAGFFFMTPAQRERQRSRRLRELNVSIEYSPDSATLYVLRGELFLERKEYYLAQEDFETALEIAEAVNPEDGWGIIEQVMRDRALAGLEKTRGV